MPSHTKEKAELRKNALGILRGMDQSAYSHASQMIGDRLLGIADDAHCIMAYWPLPSEPDISAALDELLNQEKCLCLPWVEGNAIKPLLVSDLTGLIKSNLGVYTPDPAKAEELPSEKLDLVIVPGLAFTASCERLGRGGGYYDRFLSGLASKTAKVAVAFDVQLTDSIPTEIHDASVHSIVTESTTHGQHAEL